MLLRKQNAHSVTSPADWTFVNGAVYTAMPTRTWVQAVAIAGDRVAATGSTEEMKPWIGARTQVVDLTGKMVSPGFQDAHVHPLQGGVALSQCDLTGLLKAEEYLARVRDYTRNHPDAPVIRGGGWAYGSFGAEGPRAEPIDAIVPDRPVYLTAADGHSAWVNSAALALAGVSRETPDPYGGRIERNPRTGEPTGTLREWPALNLVKTVLPRQTRQEWLTGTRAFLRKAAAYGITAVFDPMVDREFLEVYAELERGQELTVRVTAAMTCQPEFGLAQLTELSRLRREFTGDLLRAPAAKLFLDGVVESHTACLLEPYADRPNDYGEPLWSSAAFFEMASALARQGFPMHIHAVGDGAARLALEGIAKAAPLQPGPLRHQIAHLDLLAAADMPRMRQLGVTATVQPVWALIDNLYFDSSLPFLGKERANRMYPLRSMLEAGMRLSFGSDWPFGGDNVTFNPLECISVAMIRRRSDSLYPLPHAPQQSIGLEAALDACTRAAAYAAGIEDHAGTLEPGKSADLVVLDRDLRQVPPEDFPQVRPLLTLFKGKEVYRHPGW